MESTGKMTINFEQEGFEQYISVTQYDTGKKVRCNIAGISGNIGAAMVYCKKPSGLETYTDADIVDDHTVEFYITEQMNAETGCAKCQLQLFGEDKSLTSYRFKIRVRENLIADSRVTSADDYPAFRDAIEKFTGKIAGFSNELKEEKELRETEHASMKAQCEEAVSTEKTERQSADATEKSERQAADAAEKSERMQEIAVERARINNLVANNNPTEGNSELIDIRVGADGNEYSTAGEAVREQNKLLNKNLDFSVDSLEESIANQIAHTTNGNIVNATLPLTVTKTLTKSYISADNRIVIAGSGIDDRFVVDFYRVKKGVSYNIYGENVSLMGDYPISVFYDYMTTDPQAEKGSLIANGSADETNYNQVYQPNSNGYIAVARIDSPNKNQIYVLENKKTVEFSKLNELERRLDHIYYELPEIKWEPGYWTSNGKVGEYGDYKVSSFIPVEENYRIIANNLGNVGGDAAAQSSCFFDKNGEFIVSTNENGHVDVTIDNSLSENYKDIAYVSFSTSLKEEDLKSIEIKIISNSVIEQVNEKINVLANSRLDLSGKIVYTLGDSITYLSGSWAFKLAALSNAKKVYNLARGGATWRDKGDITIYDESCDIWNKDFIYKTSADGLTESYDGNSDLFTAILPTDNSNYTCISNEIRFMNRLINEWGRPKPDIIVIACGINDTSQTTIQYSEENFNEIVNTPYSQMTEDHKKTLGGGLRFCLEMLMNEYPDAQIVISTPIQSAYDYLRPYIPNTCKWINRFHQYYSTKLIDAYSNSGISAAFEKGWGQSSYQSDNEGRYLYDGLHPNDAGKIVMGNYFSRELCLIATNKV